MLPKNVVNTALTQLGASTTFLSAPATTWLSPQLSAIVKLPTTGYPLWIMDKANAPILESQSEKFYWETEKPSAVLLNLTISLDRKTLLVNHQAILPMDNGNVPPMINAYQVPADIPEQHVRGLAKQGLLNRQWEGLTLGYRSLSLDYDRLVWADPESGPYMNHVPTLRFRVMGLGAHSRSDVLDLQQQQVLHITLTDQNHRMSDDPERSYRITKVEFKKVEDSYAYAPAVEAEQNACTKRSWKCPDKGLYQNGGKPAYRFIWRSRFDKYGRIGSLRHALFRKISVLQRIWKDAGPAMMMSFGILMVPSLLILISFKVYMNIVAKKIGNAGLCTYDDSLLGEDFGEKYLDVEDEEHEVPPPLPPRPSSKEEALIDLEAGTEV